MRVAAKHTRQRLWSFLFLFLCISPLCAKDFVVVIDPGHGGHDAGAVGRKAKEKDINLGVALKLGKMISDNVEGVKVVYTRKSDTYLTLQQRADLANKANGDLFISIHTNSVDRKSPNRNTVKGASTYTLGLHRSQENLEVAKRENSVILLENDYSTRYAGFDPNSAESYIMFEFTQKTGMEQSIQFASDIQAQFTSVAGRFDKGVRQAGFWVLARTKMPSVLIELGFICNPTEEQYLVSVAGQKNLATSIYNAFVKYKSDYDRKQKSDHASAAPVKAKSAVAVPENQTAARIEAPKQQVSDNCAESGKTVYKVQLFASSQKFSAGSEHFKGLSPVDCYFEGGMYKYTYGEAASREELKPSYDKAKALFNGAFVVIFRDGRRVVK